MSPDHPEVRNGCRIESDGPRDDVAVRMMLGLVARESARLHQLLNHRVIDRHLGELVAFERVDPAVADIEDREIRLVILKGQEGTRDSGADAELALPRDHRNVVGCRLQRALDGARGSEVPHRGLGEPPHDGRTGQVPRRVAAHPVCHGEHGGLRDVTVLVCGTPATGVGGRRPCDHERVGRVPGDGHGQARRAGADLGHDCLSALLGRALHREDLEDVVVTNIHQCARRHYHRLTLTQLAWHTARHHDDRSVR